MVAAVICIVAGIYFGRILTAPPPVKVAAYDNSPFLHGASTKIVLYTQEDCIASAKVKQWLETNHVQYEERLIERTNRNWHEIQLMQVKIVPVLLAGDHRVEGFNSAAFNALLADGKLNPD